MKIKMLFSWDRCNIMIMSWINNSIVLEITQSILWMDTAEEVWKDLKDRFYQGDVFRNSDLQEDIYTTKQGDGSISTYFTKLKRLWQELENFLPAPRCSNTDTTGCDAEKKFKEYHESGKVLRFLKGLNEQYSSVRSQIMLMDPLPNMAKAYSLLFQQERTAILPTDEPKVLAINGSVGIGTKGRGDRGGRTSYGRGGRGSKVCSHCGKTGHTFSKKFSE